MTVKSRVHPVPRRYDSRVDERHSASFPPHCIRLPMKGSPMSWWSKLFAAEPQPRLISVRRKRDEPVPTRREDSCTGCGRADGNEPPRLACPACEHEMAGYNEQFLIRRIAADGEWSAPCDGCEDETFIFGREFLCDRCGRLPADASERLLQRFAGPGSQSFLGGPCPGCHQVGQALPIDVEVGCPSCSHHSWVAQDNIDKRHGSVVSCSNCSLTFHITAAVWCPDCGLNLRHLPGREINEFITQERQD